MGFLFIFNFQRRPIVPSKVSDLVLHVTHFILVNIDMSREPTRHQLSSKLAYEHKTPAFLQKLQRQYGGRRDGNDREDEYDDDEEFEDDGSGRPPIPRRPAIPERPENDHGSADEDGDDEKPQVVVLKQGKHLSEREAENEKRKGL